MAYIFLNAKPRKPKSRFKELKGIKGSKKVEWEYRDKLYDLINPFMGQLELFVEDVEDPKNLITAEEAFAKIEELKQRWQFQFNMLAKDVTQKWMARVNKWNYNKTKEVMEKALGVDVSAIFDDEELKDTFQIAMMENETLIKTIPNKFIGDVTQRIIEHYKGYSMPEGRTLAKQIKEEFKITKERAKVIARDQTSKLNGNINQTRQTSLGIDIYIWRTSQDRRVVGKPGGLYPKGTKLHKNHYVMEGKYCKWSDPTVYSDDGIEWKKRTEEMPKNHPGEDIQCRCFARPVIDVEKLKLRWMQ